MSEDLVKKFVRIWLAETEAVQEAYGKAVEEAEAAGKTIVSMGQTGSYGDDGKAEWEVTDVATGDVLASGRDDADGFGEALRKADPDGRWVNVDRLHPDPADPEPIEGLPGGLCDALVHWLENGADAPDLAEWLGEPVEVIERQMRG
ncbi:hypothetical protein [Streptomyces collinus]